MQEKRKKEQVQEVNMKKKPYKIKKSNLFKKQEKYLSDKDKEKINKALKIISKDPMNAPNSMSIFGPSSPEELKQWMARTKPYTIDLVLEYLRDKSCLNKKGSKLAHDFWKKYIKE